MSKNLGRWMILVTIATLVLLLAVVGQGLAQTGLTPKEELGQFLYFDENLSEPTGQACASCHLPTASFVDPQSDLPVSEGVIPGLFGGRNSPMSAYAMYAPIRYLDPVEGLWIGGQFWDSRATGEDLGDPLADQALGPFTNPVEMANPDEATVIRDVAASEYADLFEQVWGAGSLDNVEAAYDQVALSIAAFERTEMFGQFSSKYDQYLFECLSLGEKADKCATGRGGKARKAAELMLTAQEWRGLQLFMGDNNNDGVLKNSEGAMCVACHVADWIDPATLANNVVVPQWTAGTRAEGMIPPVFTDFTYDNLGVPKSTHPLLAGAPVDLGLGPVVVDELENGKFKVMTLRNIGDTEPYAHNGFFETLDDITHFYNTRDVPAEGWDAPEVPETINVDELGNLGLGPQDEADLVAFMEMLSDGAWTP